MSTYQAAIFQPDGSIQIESVTRPPLQDHEVRIKVLLAAICATDFALQARLLPTRIPSTLGHEFVGEVIEVGSTEQNNWIGKRVCADINFSCPPKPYCEVCKINSPHHCPKRTVLGIDGAEGAFAQEVVVPYWSLIEVPKSVDNESAVFTEPLAAALHAFTAAPLTSATNLVVLGTGRLGALIARAGVLANANVFSIIRSDRHIKRLSQFGVGEIINSTNQNVEKKIIEATNGLGADVVVEVTSTPEGLSQAINLVRPLGKIVLKSTCGVPAVGFDQTQVVVNEIQLIGSRCGDYSAAMKALEENKFDVKTLVDSKYPLPELATAMTSARQQMKVLIDPTA